MHFLPTSVAYAAQSNRTRELEPPSQIAATLTVTPMLLPSKVTVLFALSIWRKGIHSSQSVSRILQQQQLQPLLNTKLVRFGPGTWILITINAKKQKNLTSLKLYMGNLYSSINSFISIGLTGGNPSIYILEDPLVRDTFSPLLYITPVRTSHVDTKVILLSKDILFPEFQCVWLFFLGICLAFFLC